MASFTSADSTPAMELIEHQEDSFQVTIERC
jgi:hypothetical protein